MHEHQSGMVVHVVGKKGPSAMWINHVADEDEGDFGEPREGEGAEEVGVDCTQDIICNPVPPPTRVSATSFNSDSTTSTRSLAASANKPLAWLKPLVSTDSPNKTPSSVVKTIPLRPGTTSIGRDAVLNDVQLKVNSISREHAVFEVIWPCAFVVHDGRSKNGTFVNENNLGKGGKQGLQHGDKITLGEVNFVFVTTDPNDNSKQPKHSSHSSLSSNRLSRGNNQTVSTAATTVHQVKAKVENAATKGVADGGVNITCIQETVDDPIVCCDEKMSPQKNATTTQVTEAKTSSSRKRKLNLDQAPQHHSSLPIRTLTCANQKDEKEVEGVLLPSQPTEEEESPTGYTCDRIRRKGKEENQKRRNVYSMVFQQPRRSSVYFEEQPGTNSANSSTFEQQKEVAGLNSSRNCDTTATNSKCLVDETFHKAEEEKEDSLDESNDDGDEQQMEEEDDDPPFALVQTSNKSSEDISAADENCQGKMSSKSGASKKADRRPSYNYMVDDTLIVTETDDSTDVALAAKSSLFEPQIFPIPKNLLNESGSGEDVWSPPLPVQGDSASPTNANHLMISETCEQDLQSSPQDNRGAGLSALAEEKEDEEERDIFQDFEDRHKQRSPYHSSPHGESQIQKSPSMFLTNLYHQQRLQLKEQQPHLEVQVEDIDDVSCLPTPSPPPYGADGGVVGGISSGCERAVSVVAKNVLDDIYNRETVDVDDFEEELVVEDTPPLEGLVKCQSGEKQIDVEIDINQNIQTFVDDDHGKLEDKNKGGENDLGRSLVEKKNELLQESACPSGLGGVDFSDEECEDVGDSSLNGSNMLTSSQVQLVNKTISSINTPMRDRMKRRRKAKLGDDDDGIKEVVEGGSCIKFAWDAIGADSKDSTEQRGVVTVEDDFEMAATYEDDEFVDGATRGSGMLSCLKMEVAAIEATKTHTPAADKDSSTAKGTVANSRKRGGGTRAGGGRKKNQLALLQSQEIDFQDSMIVEKDASTPPKQKYAAPTDEETKAARINSEQNEKDKEAEEASLFSKPPGKRAKRLQTRKEIIAGSDEKVTKEYKKAVGTRSTRTRGATNVKDALIETERELENESGCNSLITPTTNSADDGATSESPAQQDLPGQKSEKRRDDPVISKTNEVKRSTRERMQLDENDKEELEEDKHSSDESSLGASRKGRKLAPVNSRAKRGKTAKPIEEDNQAEETGKEKVVPIKSSKVVLKKNEELDEEKASTLDTRCDENGAHVPQLIVTERVKTFQQEQQQISSVAPVVLQVKKVTTSNEDNDTISECVVTSVKGQRSATRRGVRATTTAGAKKVTEICAVTVAQAKRKNGDVNDIDHSDSGRTTQSAAVKEVVSPPARRANRQGRSAAKGDAASKMNSSKQNETKEVEVPSSNDDSNSTTSTQSSARKTRTGTVTAAKLALTPKSQKSVKFRDNTTIEDDDSGRTETSQQNSPCTDKPADVDEIATVSGRRSRMTPGKGKEEPPAVTSFAKKSTKTASSSVAGEVKKEYLEKADGKQEDSNGQMEVEKTSDASGKGARTKGRNAANVEPNTQLFVKQEPVDQNSPVRGRSRQQKSKSSMTSSTTSSKQQDAVEGGVPAIVASDRKRARPPGKTAVTNVQAEVEEERIVEQQLMNENGNESNCSSLDERSTSNKTKKKTAIKQVAALSVSASTKKESPQKSRSAGGGKTVYVVFTGLPEPLTSKYSKQLVSCSAGNVQIGDDVSKCTCLVTDKIRRTVKFLCALSQGSPIVSVQWAEACIQQQTASVDPEQYILKDEASEIRFEMKLESSLRLAKEKGGVLTAFRFFVTQSVVPLPDEMKTIIKSAQGKVLPRMPAAPSGSCPLDESTFIISCEKDATKVRNEHLRKMTRSVEFILSAIMRQQLDVSSHHLF